MERDIDRILADHRQQHPHSSASSVTELLIKLLGLAPPPLQDKERQAPLGWSAFVDQVYGRFALREFRWDREAFIPFVREELSGGRPVILVLSQGVAAGDREEEHVWLAVRFNEVGSYFFADLLTKHRETGQGDGYFTAKRVLRLDTLGPDQVRRVLYCEELYADPHPRRWPSGPKRV